MLKGVDAILSASRREHTSRNSSETAPSTLQVESTQEEALSNIFSYLEVEEPLENPLGSAPIPQPAPETNSFELETNEDATYFAVWCFFKDLNDVRQQLRGVWQDYKAGKLAFSAAATITSVSMSLMSDLSSELAEEHPTLSTCTLIYRHIGLGFVVSGGEVFLHPGEGVQQHIPSHGQKQTHGDIEFLRSRAWIILRTFSRLMHDLTRGRDESSKVPDDTCFDVHPFGRRLRAMLHEIRPFQELNHLLHNESWVPDLFLESLHLMAKTPDVPPPLWSLAACQFSMDVHDITGSTPEVEMDRYHRLHAQGVASISKLLQHVYGENSFGDVPRHLDLLRSERRVLEARASDSYQKETAEPSERQGHYTPSFRVHRLLPIFTGLLTHACLIITHRIGVSHGLGSFTVLSAAYLYRAALLAGVQTQPWPDMEVVIRSESKKQAFIRESAQGITSMPQCFGVALGLKFSAFSKSNRPPLPRVEFVDKHGRKLQGWMLSTKSNSERYCRATRVAASLAGLERLAENKSSEVQALLNRYEKTGNLSPAQLLIGAREVYAADGEILDFDYIEFAMSCHEILEKISNSCGPQLRSLVAKIQ